MVGQIIDRCVDDTIGVKISGPHRICDAVFIQIRRAACQSRFNSVGIGVIVAVGVQEIWRAVVVRIDRRVEVGLCAAEFSGGAIVGIKDVDHTIAVGIVIGHITIIGDVGCRRTGLDCVRDAVVVAVEVQVILDQVIVGINRHRTDGRRSADVGDVGIKDIQQAVAIGIGITDTQNGFGFGDRNRPVVVGISGDVGS